MTFTHVNTVTESLLVGIGSIVVLIIFEQDAKRELPESG